MKIDEARTFAQDAIVMPGMSDMDIVRLVQIKLLKDVSDKLDTVSAKLDLLAKVPAKEKVNNENSGHKKGGSGAHR